MFPDRHLALSGANDIYGKPRRSVCEFCCGTDARRRPVRTSATSNVRRPGAEARSRAFSPSRAPSLGSRTMCAQWCKLNTRRRLQTKI
jgi:hypothetical protein